jgi:hypothetical protein
LATKEIEDRIMSERRPQGMPPTPANPRFVIDVGQHFSAGTVFSSRERAERMAEQIGLIDYSIREDAA